jgi:hypothetical protein
MPFFLDNSTQITFTNTGFYGGIGADGYGGEEGGDGVKVTYSNNITFINSVFIGGRGGAGYSSAGMGFDGGDGGNGLSIQSSINVCIDSSIFICGIGGPGGYGSQGSGVDGDDGYSIFIIDTSYATVNNSTLTGNHFSDSTSTLILFNVVGIYNEIENELKSFILNQNYPNPFNPSTNIRFSISEFGLVNLKVFDVLGNEVATLINKELAAGEYEVEFNSHSGLSGIKELSSGIYFYQLKAGSYIETKKMLMLK